VEMGDRCHTGISCTRCPGWGGIRRVEQHAFFPRCTEVNRGFSQRGPEVMPYGGYGWHMRGPDMMDYRIAPFGGFFGGLLMLGFLVLIVLGIIWLVGRLRSSKPIETSTSVPAIVSEPIPAAALNTCKKCGKPLQVDWSVCPYCGKKV
jgi:hypothetical protein